MQVIQKLIERVSPDRLEFVNAFRGNVYELSTHPYGCRVLQRCFEHLPEEQTRPLLDELHKYTTNLMQDQFGVGLSSHEISPSLIASLPELCCSIRPRAWNCPRSHSNDLQAPWSDAKHVPSQVCLKRLREGSRHCRL